MAKEKKSRIETLLAKIFNVTKQSRDIQKDHLDFAKKESKRQLIVSVFLVGLAIPTFIVTVLTLQGTIQIKGLITSQNIIPDYAIKTEIVSPSQIILNTDSDILFTFNFTNVGTKNITNFKVYEIDFYRDVDKQFRQVYTEQFSTSYSLYCPNFRNDNVLMPGDYCVLKDVRFFACPKCFDDKQKSMHLYFYFGSIPPIPNDVENLTLT